LILPVVFYPEPTVHPPNNSGSKVTGCYQHLKPRKHNKANSLHKVTLDKFAKLVL